MRFCGLDPSTKTGFVALNENGKVITAKQIEGIGEEDPKRMVTMIHDIDDHLQKGDIIAIEGFPFASQQAIQLGGIGWMLRAVFFKRGYLYTEVAPNALKARVGVTGWTGEKGSKVRLKGKEKKNAVIEATEKEFGISYKNDNINDAFILAHIARENYLKGAESK